LRPAPRLRPRPSPSDSKKLLSQWPNGSVVYAQAAEATTKYLRTKAESREIHLIVERGDHRVVAIEIKLTQRVDDQDVRHLRWLADEIGDELLDAVVITTGPAAYRRLDGIAVVPAALLGP
jgi:uncharacterized protein